MAGRDWVRGTAQVVGTSDYKPSVSAQNIRLRAIVQAPGIAPFDSEQSAGMIWSSRWPRIGQHLPVLVHPRRRKWKVLWKEVETGRDRADQLAAQVLGQAEGTQATDASTASVPGLAPDVVQRLQNAFPGATITVGEQTAQAGAVPDVLQKLQDMFPGAQMTVNGTPVPAGAAGGVNVVATPGGGDPVARLEKLAKLHAAGIVDDAQFVALKKQILEGGS